MPIPAAIAVPAATSIISNGMNAWAQGRMNKKSRQWSEHMYERQRADSLSDWAMMNEYNSPVAQMQRYKDAGLNPHLIYGQTNEGATVRSSDTPSWKPEAPRFDFTPVGNSLFNYVDLRKKEAEIRNLEVANTVAVQDAALRAAQVAATIESTRKTGVDIDTAKFELGLKNDLRAVSLEAAKQSLDKLKAETTVTLDRNEREAALNASNLREAAQRILNMRMQNAKTQDERSEIKARIGNIMNDTRLKQLDIELKENGIQPNDPIYWRVLSRIIQGEGLWKKILP